MLLLAIGAIGCALEGTQDSSSDESALEQVECTDEPCTEKLQFGEGGGYNYLCSSDTVRRYVTNTTTPLYFRNVQCDTSEEAGSGDNQCDSYAEQVSTLPRGWLVADLGPEPQTQTMPIGGIGQLEQRNLQEVVVCSEERDQILEMTPEGDNEYGPHFFLVEAGALLPLAKGY